MTPYEKEWNRLNLLRVQQRWSILPEDVAGYPLQLGHQVQKKYMQKGHVSRSQNKFLMSAHG